MPAPDFHPTARLIVEEALKLSAVLEAADDIQWQPSPVPRPRDDTTERSRGGHSDPTLTTVLDDRRLKLRDEVRRSSWSLGELLRKVREYRTALEDAVDHWNGV